MNIGPYFFPCAMKHKPCSWLQHSLCIYVRAAFSAPNFIKGINWPSLLQNPHVLLSWRVSLQWSLKVYEGEKGRIRTWGWYLMTSSSSHRTPGGNRTALAFLWAGSAVRSGWGHFGLGRGWAKVITWCKWCKLTHFGWFQQHHVRSSTNMASSNQPWAGFLGIPIKAGINSKGLSHRRVINACRCVHTPGLNKLYHILPAWFWDLILSHWKHSILCNCIQWENDLSQHALRFSWESHILPSQLRGTPMDTGSQISTACKFTALLLRVIVV